MKDSGFIVETIKSHFSDDIDDLFLFVKKQYDDRNNDSFESRKWMEMVLFRIYEYKFFIDEKTHCLKSYLYDEEYYESAWSEYYKNRDLHTAAVVYDLAIDEVRNGNLEKAGDYFGVSAMMGDADAQYNYGITKTNGEGCTADPLEGSFWYWEASKHGNAKAMMNLAIAYRNGIGVIPDKIKMLYWYAKSAETLENPKAIYYLGLSMMETGSLMHDMELGRSFVYASDHLGDEKVRDSVTKIAKMIVDGLAEYV